MRLRLFFLSISLLAGIFSQKAFAQGEPINLTNPSFEDIPRHSHAPRGWQDCGDNKETPPDTQPSGTFSVTKAAKDGNTYLGMVVRDNDTYEAVSQRLSRPMQKGQCYEFSIFLCRSELYISVSRQTGQEVNYVTPAKLEIYGGFAFCDNQQMLAETSVITTERWLEYKFKLKPNANYNYIMFRAYYTTPTLFPYNGNILLDNASPLVPIPCEEEQVVADNTEPEPAPIETTPEPTTPDPEPQPETPTPQPEPEQEIVEQPATLDPVKPEPVTPKEKDPKDDIRIAGFKKSDLKKGQTIRIDNLYFESNEAKITKQSFPILDEIYNFLNVHQDVMVEIGGHTNGIPPHEICDRLSKERAEAVVSYLVNRGIRERRLFPKGYGKRRPIADNNTLNGRRKNQRVEIKVLEISDEG
ncbi:MAG: OmpA family protein [Saprospiraceae bacterium]|nr:OmpA family protein [Saprospiraceae bacterium]